MIVLYHFFIILLKNDVHISTICENIFTMYGRDIDF